jgi:hypothetical protein
LRFFGRLQCRAQNQSTSASPTPMFQRETGGGVSELRPPSGARTYVNQAQRGAKFRACQPEGKDTVGELAAGPQLVLLSFPDRSVIVVSRPPSTSVPRNGQILFLRKRVFLLLLQTLYSRAPLCYPDTHCHPPTPPLYSRETGDARASAEFTASKTSCATALWNVTESCCTANENHFVVAQVLWS